MQTAKETNGTMSNGELEGMLRKVVSEMIGNGQPTAPTQPGPWQVTPQPSIQVGGFSIPVTVPTPWGELSGYITTQPDLSKGIANGLLAEVQGLINAGIQVRFYQPRPQYNNNGGGFNRGGYGGGFNRGAGFNRGGYGGGFNGGGY